MKINVKKINKKAKLPFTATTGSAGADLFACLDYNITVMPRERVLVSTGLAVSVPFGFGGYIFPRSSTAFKYGLSLANCVGVIDSDYRGELKVAVINHGDEPYIINDGDRIAQMIILRTENVEYTFSDALDDTERGEGGFGSTGR